MSKPITNVPKVLDGEVKLIALDRLVPFSKHAFTLYQGERLDDMVESIRKNGVIVPIIVRTTEEVDKFEIISGHNRVYASGLAGLEKVPAVIKVGLSDEDALAYFILTNVYQRGFRDLKISEQAFAIAMRYKKLFDAKKLAAIDEELSIMELGGKSAGQVAPVVPPPKGNTRDLIANDYGLSRMTVSRLVRINELYDELKKLVDTGNIRIRPAVELSFLPMEVQKMLYECMSKTGTVSIDMNTAYELRELYKKKNDLTSDMVDEILSGRNARSVMLNRTHKISVTPEIYNKFLKDIPKKEVVSIVEKALEMYFKGERA